MNSTPALASTQAQYPVDPASIAAAITAAAPYPAVTKQVARRIRFSRSTPTCTPNNSNSNKTQDDDNSKNKHEDEDEDDGVFTQIVYTAFSDKILLTISQNGRLGHWIQLPLLNDSPATTNPYQPLPLRLSSHHEPPEHDHDDNRDQDQDLENPDATDPLLPATRFVPQTLLGGRNSSSSSSSSSSGGDREVLGHLLASLIAGIITERDRNEERVLLLGLGLDLRCSALDDGDADGDADERRREAISGIIELVREVV